MNWFLLGDLEVLIKLLMSKFLSLFYGHNFVLLL